MHEQNFMSHASELTTARFSIVAVKNKTIKNLALDSKRGWFINLWAHCVNHKSSG